MSPTFVLVPGAGGMAGYWHLVEQELADRGHRSVAVDLPSDDPTSSLRDHVDVIVEVAGERPDVVIVAQSLGGFAGSWAATRLPTARIVLLNAMIPTPGEMAGEWWENTGQPAARRDSDRQLGRDPDGDFDEGFYFMHDVPSSSLPDSEERPDSGGVFDHAWEPTAWPDIPTRVVVGRDDRFFPEAFQRRVARERLGLETVLIPGGHLAALSQPVEVCDAIVAP